MQYIEEDMPDLPSSGQKQRLTKAKAKESSRNALRIQDKELLEMTDEGEVLFMYCIQQ